METHSIFQYLLHPSFPFEKASALLGTTRDVSAVEVFCREKRLPQGGDPQRKAFDACAAGEALSVVWFGQPGYPESLARIAAPPMALFITGRLEEAFSVAVVGSRRPRPDSAEFARHLAGELAERGIVVVSGLARGVDSMAHRGCLDAGGRTVAVLGSGHANVYPPEHRGLARDIVKSGAVVSEYPPSMTPRKQNFPARNRIIAGLCGGVVIVEAAARSGSLITARLALEENREVFVVPGGVLDEKYVGSNFMIKDGAKLVQTVEDILEEFPNQTFKAKTDSAPKTDLSPDEARLLDLIPFDTPKTLEELAQALAMPVPALFVLVTALELKGLLERVPGGKFARRMA
jgi:DNA processing protein